MIWGRFPEALADGGDEHAGAHHEEESSPAGDEQQHFHFGGRDYFEMLRCFRQISNLQRVGIINGIAEI